VKPWAAFASVMMLSVLTTAQAVSTKPVVLIAGDGNITVTSNGTVVGGRQWATGIGQTSVSKHNQTMEMAQDLLQSCPGVEVTLDQNIAPDYYLVLNREGGAYNIGQSQIMAVNRRKTVLFVGKKGTVKNAVRSACNAIVADWQANGRIAVASPNSPPPQQGVNNLAAQDTTVTPKVAALDAAATPTVTQDAPPKPAVALELQTTARAQKYCKPQTITDVMSDTTAYLTAKGVAMGTIAVSSYKLTLVVDRPLSKWIKITVQMRDHSDNLLWSETVEDGGWGHAGGTGTLNVLDKIHQIMDAKLGAQNGLPVVVQGN